MPVVVLPSEGEEPVTRIARDPSSAVLRPHRKRAPKRAIGLGGGGREGKGIERGGAGLLLLRNPREDGKPVKAPELLLAPEPRVEHLDRERGGDAEHDAGEKSTDNAEEGAGADRGDRKLCFGEDLEGRVRTLAQHLKLGDLRLEGLRWVLGLLSLEPGKRLVDVIAARGR